MEEELSVALANLWLDLTQDPAVEETAVAVPIEEAAVEEPHFVVIPRVARRAAPAHGAAERRRVLFHAALTQPYVSWPRRWDDFVPFATWIHRGMPYASLPGRRSTANSSVGSHAGHIDVVTQASMTTLLAKGSIERSTMNRA